MNGSSWQGSALRIEVAKESFLDRLKRERAKRLEQQQPSQIQSDDTKKFEKLSGGDVAKSKQYEVIPNEKKRIWENYAMDSGVLVGKSNYSEGAHPKTSDVKPKKKKKNDEEEKMMESFKSFSSVWADSDEEEGQEASTTSASNKKVKRELEQEAEVNIFAEDKAEFIMFF